MSNQNQELSDEDLEIANLAAKLRGEELITALIKRGKSRAYAEKVARQFEHIRAFHHDVVG